MCVSNRNSPAPAPSASLAAKAAATKDAAPEATDFRPAADARLSSPSALGQGSSGFAGDVASRMAGGSGSRGGGGGARPRGRASSRCNRRANAASPAVSHRLRFALGSLGKVSLEPVVSLQEYSARWLGALLMRWLRPGLPASAIGLAAFERT